MRSYIYFTSFLLLTRKRPSTGFCAFGNMSFYLHMISDPHLDFFYLLNRSYLNRIFSTWFVTFVVNFIAMDQAILRIYNMFLLVLPISLGRFLMTRFLKRYCHAHRSVTVNAWVLCSRFVLTTISVEIFTKRRNRGVYWTKYIISHKCLTPQLVS